MIKLSKEQQRTLKKHEYYLTQAYKANYISMLSAAAASDLLRVYEELGFKRINAHCGSCALTMCTNLGRIYFNQPTKLDEEKTPDPTKLDEEKTPDPTKMDEEKTDDPTKMDEEKKTDKEK